MEYQIMFYGGLAGAIISLGISIVVFLKLNISEAIEDLTGYRFRSRLKRLFSRFQSNRGQAGKPITSEIQPRQHVPFDEAVSDPISAADFMNQKAAATELLVDETLPATELLDDGSERDGATELLIDNRKLAAQAATELLQDNHLLEGQSTVEWQLKGNRLTGQHAAKMLVEDKRVANQAATSLLVDDQQPEATELLVEHQDSYGDEIEETLLLEESMEETTLLAVPEVSENFIIETDVVIVHSVITI